MDSNPQPTAITGRKGRAKKDSGEVWERSQGALGLWETHLSLCAVLTHAVAIVQLCYQRTTGPNQGQVTL